MNSIDLNATTNNYTVTVLPILLNFLDKNRNFSANITTMDKEFTVTLINGSKIKRIKDKSLNNLSDNLKKILRKKNGFHKIRQVVFNSSKLFART